MANGGDGAAGLVENANLGLCPGLVQAFGQGDIRPMEAADRFRARHLLRFGGDGERLRAAQSLNLPVHKQRQREHGSIVRMAGTDKDKNAGECDA